jgi:anaerobic magnesium-protoporphyrin IX monomethyl ester cyclase
LYLAPEKRINYSPARGCFWNKCTFCDYGLNSDSPTAPSRTMDPDTCASHLSTLAANGVHRVYLAVDAIAPKFLNALADELHARKLELEWSTQFFLTRQFTPELVTKLANSGLRIASFGLESGSSRILEKMGKGKNRVEQELLPAFRSFRESTIGLQPLFFYGFPGETKQDRRLTVELLTENSDIFATISKGGLFTLLTGSIVAKDPQRFGIRNTRRRSGENISGELEYDIEEDPCNREDSFAEFNDCLPHWNLWERPWVGGIDTLHTQLYVERFGRQVFRELQQQYGRTEEPWASIAVSSKFDLDQVMTNVMLHDALKCQSALELVAGAGISAGIVEQSLASTESEDETKEYVVQFRQYREI